MALFFGDEQPEMADSGTPVELLKKKFPGMFPGDAPANAGASGIPLFDSGSPTAPANGNAPAPVAPGMAQPENKFNLPWLPGYKSQQQAPARPAMTTPNGQMVPGLSKAQKLQVLLKSGLQGALAGRASSEQALIASGGHRSGGAGMGFEAGLEAPVRRQSEQLGLQQQQANVEATRGQAEMINTPSGPMPAWLAKAILPASIRGQATENAADTRAGASVQGAQIGAGAKVQAAQIGQKFKAVPGVGLFDTESRQIVPGSANGVTITPEIAQDYKLPQEFVGKPMNVSQLASLERNEISAAPTVKSSTDPLGLTTTSTSTKQLSQKGGASPNATVPRGAPARPQARGGGGGGGGGGGSNLDQMARNLVEGNIDPSQVPKRSAAYTIIANKADTYSRNTYGKPFDMAAAASEYQYAKNTQTQNVLKLIDGITAKGGSLEIAMNAAKKLPQMNQQTINKVFNLGGTEFGSDEASNFHTAMLGLADEYSKVMGGGVSSDTGRQQGLDLLKAQYSKGQFSGAADIIKKDVAARKSGLIGDNRYLQRQYNQRSTPSGGGNAGGHVIALQGKQYRYNGSGDTADIKNYTQVTAQ